MALISPFGKVTCPFCFERFHLSQAPLRNTALTAPTEPDTHVGRFLGPQVRPPELGRVVPPPTSDPFAGFRKDSDSDGKPTDFPPVGTGPLAWLKARCLAEADPPPWRKICPNCHMMLTTALSQGNLASQIIAIVGTRSSGKSNFFGVLIDRLLYRYSAEVGFTVTPQETYSVDDGSRVMSEVLYRKRYGSLHQNQPRAVPQTASGMENPDARIPLIYRLTFPKHGSPTRHDRRFADHLPMDLVIFDTAGEDLDDLARLEHFARYGLNAAGLIFMLDPFQFQGLRQELPPETAADATRPPAPSPEDHNRDPLDAVSRMLNQFEINRQVRPETKVRIPTAFVLSKCDEFRHLLPDDSPLQTESRHKGGFDRIDCYRASADLADLLHERDRGRLTTLADSRFQDWCLFAISALGARPERTSSAIPAINAIRIGDPLLWILWRLGYIPERDV